MGVDEVQDSCCWHGGDILVSLVMSDVASNGGRCDRYSIYSVVANNWQEE